ncbi:MAG: HEPN domain-containing protein [Spirochaetaceae bacterium]|nr:HEPN domain-containing protein [Spirochaetaceae bacterium]
MSAEKARAESDRWLATADDDLEAAEKSLKAAYFSIDGEPWGHSLVKLIDEIGRFAAAVQEKLAPQTRSARILDRFYIPTRNPDGLPDIAPKDAFAGEDSESALKAAREIRAAVGAIVG